MLKKILFIIKGLHISASFREKLRHNFHELTSLEMIIYFLFISIFWNKEKRFFFEGKFWLPGQMYIADRKALFIAILDKKPRQCFEIGTYTGGGSTYFLSAAFDKLGQGELITMETNNYLYEKASNYYKSHLSALNSHVNFLHGAEVGIFDLYIDKSKGVDSVFFDGAEDNQETVDQYLYFLPYFHKGSFIMMHDWNTEKTAGIKPLILNNPRWKIIQELNPPESVGFAIAEMI